MKEIWKDVKGTNGIYQVSNMGNVRKYLPQSNNRGYRVVSINGKLWLVHRLVAETFIPNPDGLPLVNHKDEVRSNNCVENLEWYDPKYNINYGTRTQRTFKPIIAINQDGEITEFESLTSASKALKVSKAAINKAATKGIKVKGNQIYYKFDFYRLNLK